MYSYEAVSNRSDATTVLSYLVVRTDSADGSKIVIAKCGTSGDADLIVTKLNA